MSYDPAWDMPKINWMQQGSFESGEIPIAYAPTDAPLVCIPPINRYWLPLVLGCLDQLCNPSTWITSGDAATNAILDKAAALKQVFGQAGACPMYSLRLTSSCVLQYSTDGGSTWADVTGWDANFANCVSGVTIPGIPGNPGGVPAPQLGCNIAGYLATRIIQAAITQAVDSFNHSQQQIDFAVAMLDLIGFAFPITLAAGNAFYDLYSAYTLGTIADFTSASTDNVLWGEVTCAIYEAIRGTGYITATNLGNVISNVCGISYTHAEVISAICAFITAVGLQNLQKMQSVAVVDNIDCSACASPPGWCKSCDFSAGGCLFGPTGGGGNFVPGTGWQSSAGSGFQTINVQSSIAGTPIFHATDLFITYDTSVTFSTTFSRVIFYKTGTAVLTHFLPEHAGGLATEIIPVNMDIDTIQVIIASTPDTAAFFYFTGFRLTGTGTAPYSGEDCP